MCTVLTQKPGGLNSLATSLSERCSFVAKGINKVLKVHTNDLAWLQVAVQ